MGMPVAWCLATPKLGSVRSLRRCWTRGPRSGPGLRILGDKGFAGREFDQSVSDLGAGLLRPDRRDEPRRLGAVPLRQWIESIFDTLKDQLSLEQHGGRTRAGVFVRVAQRLLALAAASGGTGRPASRQAMPGRLRPLSPRPIRNHSSSRPGSRRP